MICYAQFFFVNFAAREGTTKREELAPTGYARLYIFHTTL